MTDQPNLTDDPTSYLKRDPANPVIVLAGSVAHAQEMAQMYGVSIQVNMPGSQGIRVVSTQQDAINAIATFPQATPWCIVNDGLTDKTTRDVLTSWFGKPKSVDKALGVTTDGIAWRSDKMFF